MAVKIDKSICENCAKCVGINYCPMGVYTIDEKTGEVVIDNEKCVNCGLCVNMCPTGAIKFED
ncbi:MAG: 4Fe-4S dicluster domain-containing protein [Christensenellales bacterium]